MESFEHFSANKYFLDEDDDPILRAIRKYKTHPSILKVNEAASIENDNFAFEPTNYESVVKEIFALNPAKASPMDSVTNKNYQRKLRYFWIQNFY